MLWRKGFFAKPAKGVAIFGGFHLEGRESSACSARFFLFLLLFFLLTGRLFLPGLRVFHSGAGRFWNPAKGEKSLEAKAHAAFGQTACALALVKASRGRREKAIGPRTSAVRGPIAFRNSAKSRQSLGDLGCSGS